MDTTIRNLDPQAYRELKAQAARTGRTVGDLVNEAIRAWLLRSSPAGAPGSLADLVPVAFPAGTEHLSEQVDALVYGQPD